MADEFTTRWSQSQFGISETRHDGVQVLNLHGELDMGQIDGVRHRLRQLIAEDRETVLDLSQLTFLDTSGIELLYRATRPSDDGWTLEIRNPAGVVLRTLELAGVSDLLLR